MGLVFAGLSSFLFGAADFSGGVATKRAPATAVVLTSQAVGLSIAIAVMPWLGGPLSASDIGWSAAAGVAGSAGLIALYSALATTSMAIAAPVTALVGAAVPLGFGLAFGERPGLVAWIGIAVAIPAILLLAASPEHEARTTVRRAVVLGSTAGTAFGLFFVFISRTSEASELAPLVVARLTSLMALALLFVVTRRSLVAVRDAKVATILAGVLDMAANLFFLLAVRSTLLVIVSVVSSLYPVGTVSLAAGLLGEKPRPHQLVGLMIAVGAVALIALD